jgi:hypothetical protein
VVQNTSIYPNQAEAYRAAEEWRDRQ